MTKWRRRRCREDWCDDGALGAGLVITSLARQLSWTRAISAAAGSDIQDGPSE